MRGNFISRRILQRFRHLAISSVGSVKMKLLLCCCIAFTFVLIAGRAASFMAWTHHHDSLRHFPTPRKGYTILINTWKRYDLLKQSISHYASCAGLESIHIVWSEPDPPSDSLREFIWRTIKSNSRDGKDIELRFDINKEDSLNNRFKEIKDLKTDAIFSIDDDVIFPCTSVEFAFSVWQSAPDTMVGFVPRSHWVDKSKESMEYYTYGGWWSVWWMGTYSMVLSKAAFFHKKYLFLYTNQMPTSIREYVAKNRNCEDIAMSFLVANTTGAPPIWVKGKIFEIGSTGISSLGGHNKRRTQCVNKFVGEYGRMPLVSTSVKAVDSRNSLFW
ncbi:glycosylinositol phosphorylceramide mannosyl transferase 1-like isoform X2 [Telopea speciosissima]|uniref:glycosylinositol phosphorylceramide mannosyl transferase 1-like isoform X2 n=1 Tax=Telopea speciosissima TaxID=54955 RepID=UPI001CC5C867|nr:glycosylinositol phosphorylceramide mannosyl transferase 1-like isoform X2 [Telopea speciosissima]